MKLRNTDTNTKVGGCGLTSDKTSWVPKWGVCLMADKHVVDQKSSGTNRGNVRVTNCCPHHQGTGFLCALRNLNSSYRPSNLQVNVKESHLTHHALKTIYLIRNICSGTIYFQRRHHCRALPFRHHHELPSALPGTSPAGGLWASSTVILTREQILHLNPKPHPTQMQQPSPAAS